MIRRDWFLKTNLLNQLTNYIESSRLNFNDHIFLKEFNKDVPMKIKWWPGMPDYGDIEDRPSKDEGFK